MAIPGTILYIVVVLALLSVTFHPQAQGALEPNGNNIDTTLEHGQFGPRMEQMTMAMRLVNTMDQICASCNCCISKGNDPEVCYTRCCFDRSSCNGSKCELSGLESCGCNKCSNAALG
ncbi:unnamed protein product [Urochloa decumbens]|uniref:Uncharacterized protein n=1 Tax=Urochloa decumbens TaxID=240449 RepID=A0ABC8YDQ6_9POAL